MNKKGLLSLILSASILGSQAPAVGQSRRGYSPRLTGIIAALTSCIKNADLCDDFERLRKEEGLKLGENHIDGQDVFYYKGMDGYFLGKIEKKKSSGKANIYHLEKIASTQKRKAFTRRIKYDDGSEDIIIDAVYSRNKAKDISDDWPNIKENNLDFKEGRRWDPVKQALYRALEGIEDGDIQEAYQELDRKSSEAHEEIPHNHNDVMGEVGAHLAELKISYFALNRIERYLRNPTENQEDAHYRRTAEIIINGLLGLPGVGNKRKLYSLSKKQFKEKVELLEYNLFKKDKN